MSSTTSVQLYSDNTVGASPEVIEAIVHASAQDSMPYGNDTLTSATTRRFCELFETKVSVFPVGTGTAANAVALAALCPPYGAIYTHPQAHIQTTECNAPEFYTGGAKLVGVPSPTTKISQSAFDEMLKAALPARVHEAQPSALSITQATEGGAVYTIDEAAALAETARKNKLRVHMDGARFANAVASLGCTPAEITWKIGVDILVFGMTKNGTLNAEAIVVFNNDLAGPLAFFHKRGGHLFSKMRILSAQLDAMISGDLWLNNARHANTMARTLAQAVANTSGLSTLHPVEANMVHLRGPRGMARQLNAAGYQFKSQDVPDGETLRIVTSHQTQKDDIVQLAHNLRQLQI